MPLLIAGLLIFICGHLVSTQRGFRARLIARLGEGAYKGVYSLVACIGLALIVIGFSQYRAAGYIDIWDPPRWTRHVALTLMWFAFVSVSAAYAPRGKIAGWMRHPMLVAVKIWALAHLLANGDLGSVILMGSILAFAVFDRISTGKRGDPGAPRAASFGVGDAVAIVTGTIAYVAMLYLHPYLIGVPVMGV